MRVGGTLDVMVDGGGPPRTIGTHMSSTRPLRSYVLWFSQRVGSTLLAQALEDTGVAGRPREWFNADQLARGEGTLRDRLWRAGTGNNGVLGLKYGPVAGVHTTVLDALRSAGESDEQAWGAAFPDCRHVFLTRRNKVRLAVSWWRAIQVGTWHRRPGEPPGHADLADAYDFDAIQHLYIEAGLREAAIQDWFDRLRVVPLTVVYEDLTAAYSATVRRVLAHVVGPGAEGIDVSPPAFERLADTLSEEWVERFRADQQAGWAHTIW